MQLPIGEEYRGRFARLAPELPRLRTLFSKHEASDVELCFRALYAVMLYRIKGGGERAIEDTLAVISPAIGELAAMHGKVERGEINLFED